MKSLFSFLFVALCSASAFALPQQVEQANQILRANGIDPTDGSLTFDYQSVTKTEANETYTEVGQVTAFFMSKDQRLNCLFSIQGSSDLVPAGKLICQKR